MKPLTPFAARLELDAERDAAMQRAAEAFKKWVAEQMVEIAKTMAPPCPDCDPVAFDAALERAFGAPTVVDTPSGPVKLYADPAAGRDRIYSPHAFAREMCPKHRSTSPEKP